MWWLISLGILGPWRHYSANYVVVTQLQPEITCWSIVSRRAAESAKKVLATLTHRTGVPRNGTGTDPASNKGDVGELNASGKTPAGLKCR